MPSLLSISALYQPNDTWADQYHPDFGRAMRFLEESTAVRERDRRAEEEPLRAEQERRERDIRRRSVRRTLALVVVVAVLGVLGTLGISVARREFIRHALVSDLGWVRISAPPGGQFMMGCAETAELHAAGKASLWRDPDLQVALDWREL